MLKHTSLQGISLIKTTKPAETSQPLKISLALPLRTAGRKGVISEYIHMGDITLKRLTLRLDLVEMRGYLHSLGAEREMGKMIACVLNMNEPGFAA